VRAKPSNKDAISSVRIMGLLLVRIPLKSEAGAACLNEVISEAG
jgi:hypothetical protein